MRTLMLLPLLLILTGCPGAETRPDLPKTVSVTVEKYREVPAWVTAKVEKPMPADGSVAARVESNEARGNLIDYVNCRSALFLALLSGRSADPKTCAK